MSDLGCLEEYLDNEEPLEGLDPELEARLECLKAKLQNPEMFVSAFDADEGGIEGAEDPDSPGERLLTAAEEGKLDLVKDLLNFSGDLVKYKDKDGYTALHRAAYSEHIDIIRFLISKGAEVDAVTEDGWTALHSACHWNAFKSVRELLDNNADPNSKTVGGQTPLHVASHQQSRESMIILLTCPYADLIATNHRGETAEEIGRRGKYGNLFDMNRESINKL